MPGYVVNNNDNNSRAVVKWGYTPCFFGQSGI